MSKQLKVDLIANTSQFKRAMSETSNQIKLLNSEFRNAAAETDKYGNKIDATGAKKRQLSGVIEQYKMRVQAIKNEQKHWRQELEKGNITEEEHAQKQQELARRLNNTEAEMKRYEGQLKRLNAEGKKTRMTFEEFDKKFRDVGRTMRNVGAQVGITAGVGFMAMKRVLGDVVEEAMTFEAQMSEVQAISGATGDELARLTQQSKDLGRQTVFTAQQAAEAQANLARAGFNVNEIYDAMPGMLDLAASSKLELSNAANITSNIIRTFNLEASESARVADVLAKGAATANTDVQGLGQAMEVAGPVAHSLGISLESVAAATGIMADAGIDGSKAGRMLRQGMIRLSKPTGEAAKIIEDLGINTFDADGNMKSLDGIIAELQKGMRKYNKQQRAAALATLFGSESTAGWTVLLEKGSDVLDDYTKDLINSEGAAKEMAKTMQDNAQGAIIRMQSALSGLKIELGEKLLPTLGRGADFVADFATKLAEMDESTVQTVAQTALLVTAVLGVTTAVAGLVAGIGAFMAFAGPVGAAITVGTALLGGLAAATYKSSLETERLKEEQERGREEAIRYGEGLSEGTLKGVQGYTDLFEGAKLKMLELRTMSGEEAEKTVKEIQSAFSEMGDTVIAELEQQRDDLTRVIREVYAVAGEYGKEFADELSSEVVERFQKDISEYEKAVSTVNDIIAKHGADVSKYPGDVRKAYDEALSIMEQGSSEFARTHQELINIQQAISEKEGKLLYAEQEQFIQRVNDAYRESIDAMNEWYYDKTSVIDQALAQDRITAEEHENLMAGIEASTNEMFAKASQERENALNLLAEHADTQGKLIDFMTGKEFERLEVETEVTGRYGMEMGKRRQTDEEYLQSWLDHVAEITSKQGEASAEAQQMYEQQLAAFLESMGHTKEEAAQIAHELVEETLSELEKGDDDAEKAGKDKGDAHKDGLESTKKDNEKAGKDISKATDDELNRNKDTAQKAGTDKGQAHKSGLESTQSANLGAGDRLSSIVSSALAKTTDGGGGRKAGGLFASGVRGQRGSASSAGRIVSSSAQTGLRQFNTRTIGTNFVSGFRNAISSGAGSVWNVAWSLGQRALNALSSSIRTGSPSRETEERGDWFVDGFVIAIDKGKKKAIDSAKVLGKESVNALNDELNHYKNNFGALALSLENNKQSLKVEHEVKHSSLENRISSLENVLEKLINVMSGEREVSTEQNIVMNISVRNNDDINRIDSMLNDLAERRRKALGG